MSGQCKKCGWDSCCCDTPTNTTINIVREIMPNGMPFLIQGEITESGDTYSMDVDTVRVHPISPDGMALPELPHPEDDFLIASAIRLTKLYTEENN
jgi:hypothetical protein